MDATDTYQDWLNARENARAALDDIRGEGVALAKAEAAYYRTKSVAYARLRATKGITATDAQNMVKGEEDVNAALMEYRAAESHYKAAVNASQLFNNEEAHTYDQHKRAVSAYTER